VLVNVRHLQPRYESTGKAGACPSGSLTGLHSSGRLLASFYCKGPRSKGYKAKELEALATTINYCLKITIKQLSTFLFLENIDHKV
jgi:hypothetical protein